MSDRQLLEQCLEALEPIALYRAYNGDDWPARQVAPVITALRARLAERECTCHPDDNPPVPCAKQYALTECRRAQEERRDEPVAFYVYEWINPSDGHVYRSLRHDENHMGRPADRVIAVPPRRELSEEDVCECFTSTNTREPLEEGWPGLLRFARAIERKVRG